MLRVMHATGQSMDATIVHVVGGAENAGPENAGPENGGPSSNAASLCR